MSMTLTLPKLGVNMTEAVIVAWRVKEGDPVREGDILLEAETDKAIQEVPSTMTGVVGRILAREGETVACQAPIALLLEPGEAPAARAPAAAVPAAAAPAAPVPAARPKPESRPVPAPFPLVEARPQHGKPGRQRISPLARKTAAAMGIDEGSLAPARPGARIVRADVLLAAAGQERSAASTAASGAAEASQLSLEAGAGRLLALMERFEKSYGPVGLLPLLVMVLARTLKLHPLAPLARPESRPSGIDIAVMKLEGKDLCVGTMHDADSKGLLRIAEELAQGLQDRGFAEGSSPTRLVVIDLRAYGVDSYLPSASMLASAPILALGGIRRGQAQGGEDLSSVRLSLAFDGKAIGLASATEFLAALKGFVEDPSLILAV